MVLCATIYTFSDLLHDLFVSVATVARTVTWSCLVEDASLFFRFFLEKLTSKAKQVSSRNRKAPKNSPSKLQNYARVTDNVKVLHPFQEELLSLLRKVLLTFSELPSQAAYTLLNYLVSVKCRVTTCYAPTKMDYSDSARIGCFMPN